MTATNSTSQVQLEQKFSEQYKVSLLYVANDDHSQRGKLLLNSTTERLLSRLNAPPNGQKADIGEEDISVEGEGPETEPELLAEDEEEDEVEGDDDPNESNDSDGDNLDDDGLDDEDVLDAAIPNARSVDDFEGDTNKTNEQKEAENTPKNDSETNQAGKSKQQVFHEETAKKRRDATPEEYRKLQRVTGLVDVIRSALRDIATFRNRDIAKKKATKNERRKGHNEMRLQALEHQRDRLNKQKIEHERSGASTNSVATTDSADDKSGEEASDGKNAEGSELDKDTDGINIEDDGIADVDDEAYLREDPWIRLIRAINSLAIVTPMLLDIFLHKNRNNKDFQIGRANLNKKRNRRAAMCWLFGEHVFDVCTNTNCKTMFSELCEIFFMVGVVRKDCDEASIRASWRPSMEHMMTKLCQATFLNSMASSTANGEAKARHPLSSLCQSDTNLEQLNEKTQILDEKWGLKAEVQSPDQKKTAKEYQQSISRLHGRVLELLSRRFKDNDLRLSVYGSCLSNLSLGKGSDVDMSLYLRSIDRIQNNFENGTSTAGSFDRQRKNTVFNVTRKLESCWDFCKMTPIAHARVPVIKGTWTNAKNPYSVDGSIDFDICLLNDIAVVNSSLILEYCNVDERVPLLCKAIKKWAKGNNVSSAADSTLSSYAWTNMVLVFLQSISFVPDLQSPALAKRANVVRSESDPWHCINNLDTFYLKWKEVSKVWSQPEIFNGVSVSALVFGFFEFYSEGARSDYSSPFLLLGLKQLGAGKINPRTVLRKCTWFWAVEDPFETFDSHCPHDLASHADEKGAIRILQYVRETYDILKAAIADEEPVASIEWPSCAILDEKSDKKQQKGRKKGGGANKGPTQKQDGVKGAEVKDGTANGQKQNGRKSQKKQDQARGPPRPRNNPRKSNEATNKQSSKKKEVLTNKPSKKNEEPDKQPAKKNEGKNTKPNPSTKPDAASEEPKNAKQPIQPPGKGKRQPKNQRRFEHKKQRGKNSNNNNNNNNNGQVAQKNGPKQQRNNVTQSKGRNAKDKDKE